VICVSASSVFWCMEQLLTCSPFSLIQLKLFFPFAFSPERFSESFAMGARDAVQFCFQFVECCKNALSPRAAVFLWERKLMLIKNFKS